MKITKEHIGKKVIVSDSKDFDLTVEDILEDIIQIEDETWYKTEDNGMMPYGRLKEEQCAAENTICKWTRDIDARSLFHTRCSDSFQLCEDEEILDDDFKFCPYCGGEIEIDAE